jgi:hypothetical protein
MQSHRRRRRRRRIRALALGLAACTAIAAPASAQAIRDTPAHYPGAHPAPAIKIGDTPADFATATRWTALARSYALAAPKVGDTPVDHPGASRAPEYTAPTTIQVVRPERTIVRDVDEALPVVLSSAALLVALGGCTFLLVASIRRSRPGH